MAKAKTSPAAKVDFKPIFWITGNYYDCQLTWNLIKSKMPNSKVNVVDCGPGGCTASDVILLLKHKNVFDAQPRILKLKGIPEDYAEITDYLKLVNDKTVLVIDGPVGYIKSPSDRLISAATSNFYKTISSVGKVFEFDDDAPDDGTAKKWIAKVVGELGKKIDDDAAMKLVANAGLNYDFLYSHIIKLIDYSAKTITKQDVDDCVAPNEVKVIWNIMDLLDRRQFDIVFCELQKIYDKSSTTASYLFRGQMENYYGALTQHYDFLVRSKDACASVLSYNVLTTAMSGLNKIAKDKEGAQKFTELYDKNFINRNLQKDGFKAAFVWPKGHAYAVLMFLIQARTSMRMVDSEAWHRMLLDLCFMFICGKIDTKSMQRLLSSHNHSV